LNTPENETVVVDGDILAVFAADKPKAHSTSGGVSLQRIEPPKVYGDKAEGAALEPSYARLNGTKSFSMKYGNPIGKRPRSSDPGFDPEPNRPVSVVFDKVKFVILTSSENEIETLTDTVIRNLRLEERIFKIKLDGNATDKVIFLSFVPSKFKVDDQAYFLKKITGTTKKRHLKKCRWEEWRQEGVIYANQENEMTIQEVATEYILGTTKAKVIVVQLLVQNLSDTNDEEL
jgi:hypothetical protein